MSLGKNALSIIAVVLVVVYAIGSGLWVSTGDTWYQALKRPWWQPPDVVFGLIWPYNFLVLGIVGFLVTQRMNTQIATTWNIALLISVVAALTWAYQFYVPHHLLVASIALAICALANITPLALAWKTSPTLMWFLVPYQLWLTIATTLSFGYWHLN